MVLADSLVVDYQIVNHSCGKASASELLAGKHIRDATVSSMNAYRCESCKLIVKISTQKMVRGVQ